MQKRKLLRNLPRGSSISKMRSDKLKDETKKEEKEGEPMMLMQKNSRMTMRNDLIIYLWEFKVSYGNLEEIQIRVKVLKEL